MSEKIGISTGKGFHGDIPCLTTSDVPVGSIVVSKGTAIQGIFTTGEKTFYCVKDPLLPKNYSCLYEAQEDIPSANGGYTVINGTFICCGEFQDPAYVTGSGAVTQIRIWQRIK